MHDISWEENKMIATAIILGATLFIGISLLAKYWNKVLDVLKRAINKLKHMVSGVLVGSSVFIKKLGDKFQNRTKHYSKTEMDKWEETVVSYEQNPEEIPEEYRNYAGFGKEYDLTMELEIQLKNNR